MDTDTHEEDHVRAEAVTGVMLPQVKEQLWPSEAARGQEEASPNHSGGIMALPTPRSDFEPPELRQDKFVLFSAVRFVVLCDSSHRTPSSVVQGKHMAGVPALLQGCQGRGQCWLSRLSTPPFPFNTPALAFLPQLIPSDFSVVCLPFQPCVANPYIKSPLPEIPR